MVVDRSDRRRGDPDKDAEADEAVRRWAAQPPFEPGEDAREKQAASRMTIRVNRAVEKYMRDGLTDDDFERMAIVARRRASEPLDQDILARKLAHAADQMVNLILTGEVTPRSAAEAVNVAEALVRIANTLKIDHAALAAAVAAQEQTISTRERFMDLMKGHIVNTQATDAH